MELPLWIGGQRHLNKSTSVGSLSLVFQEIGHPRKSSMGVMLVDVSVASDEGNHGWSPNEALKKKSVQRKDEESVH